ncbi:MAG: hypothetical protein HYU42_02025 [Candidatus Rokubacteria bacterium]|nr:hypothetical protein [Candidatus Rokubacteria bacterium]
MEPLCLLHVPGALEELIRRLHPEIRRKVRAALDVIRADPAAGKELRSEESAE